MPIEKQSSAKLIKFGYQFDAYPRQIIQSITNLDALGYYTYLNSLPQEWRIRRKHLTEHFGIGRHRHLNAMKVLREMRLVWYEFERDETGKLIDRMLMCGVIPCEQDDSSTFPRVSQGFPTVPLESDDKTLGDATLGPVIRQSDDPTVGKSDPLKRQTLVKETDIVKDNQVQKWHTFMIESFDRFWAIYPRKVSKKQAKKAWFKVVTDEALTNKIMQNVSDRVQIGDWSTNRVEFIPHASTYLNGEKWEDEIELPQKQTKTRHKSLHDDLTDTSWAK